METVDGLDENEYTVSIQERRMIMRDLKDQLVGEMLALNGIILSLKNWFGSLGMLQEL